jgi:hypothetical protein
MRFRRAVPGVARHLCLHTLILILLASSAGLASRAWAQPSCALGSSSSIPACRASVAAAEYRFDLAKSQPHSTAAACGCRNAACLPCLGTSLPPSE